VTLEPAHPTGRLGHLRARLQQASRDGEGQVGLALGGMALLTAAWACFWPIPTEVIGRGVFIVPGGASVIDARAPGQILTIHTRVGETVRKGQALITITLPVLEQELRRQERDLRELIRLNQDLDRRDQARLASARRVRDTALAKLTRDRLHYDSLRATYQRKVADFRYLAQQQVVAPLAQEVVGTEDRATQLDVALAELRIREKDALDSWEKVRLAIEAERLKRLYRIDDQRRSIAVTRARLAFDGTVVASGEGRLLDLQVVPGQTVRAGQRLGTLGSRSGQGGQGLRAIAYFAPADARRLRPGLELELVPDWNERARFGGLEGRVERVSLLPATREDIDTTLGNPQLAEALVQKGPVMRTEIRLLRRPGKGDAYRWTLSQGSRVFPIQEGLTLEAHGYVEWRPAISYLLPSLRNLTGSYRTLQLEQQQAQPSLEQRPLP
jgi:HlyD family secretion protein